MKSGNDVVLAASYKDVTFDLINHYNFPYCQLNHHGDSLLSKFNNIILNDVKLYKFAKTYRPDIIIGFGSVRAAHISRALGVPCVIFDDDEYSYPYYSPFVDAICVFSGFKLRGRKVTKINSYKELAYLHPDVFHPDPTIYDDLGISRNDMYVILRFVGWSAYHDVGKQGLNYEDKIQLVDTLGEYAKVFISSEKPLPRKLNGYRLPIPPHRIHDALAYATLLVSDSQTMTTEAAVLGTPALRCNSFVGEKDMNNFKELENNYKLIFNYKYAKDVFPNLINLIKENNIKMEWMKRKEMMLKEKYNPNKFMIKFLNRYN